MKVCDRLKVEIVVSDEICDQGCCAYMQYSVIVNGEHVNGWCDNLDECLEDLKEALVGDR